MSRTLVWIAGALAFGVGILVILVLVVLTVIPSDRNPTPPAVAAEETKPTTEAQGTSRKSQSKTPADKKKSDEVARLEAQIAELQAELDRLGQAGKSKAAQTPKPPPPDQDASAVLSKSKADQSADTKGAHPTEAERNYIGAALSYLKTANEQGMKLARTMAGASDGSSTLTEIKNALSRARTVERLGYEGDYRKRINDRVPMGWSDISASVDKSHKLFQSGIAEMLEYWEDENPAHIASGQQTLKLSVTTMNQTIADLNARAEKSSAPSK